MAIFDLDLFGRSTGACTVQETFSQNRTKPNKKIEFLWCFFDIF